MTNRYQVEARHQARRRASANGGVSAAVICSHRSLRDETRMREHPCPVVNGSGYGTWGTLIAPVLAYPLPLWNPLYRPHHNPGRTPLGGHWPGLSVWQLIDVDPEHGRRLLTPYMHQ